ncbi:hypothetical protein ABB07_37800 [Streptomyces incarnatus]|uniref:Uncharacterized protein n=1 Tax=Streptomyces incarnatus TaxID=665007 RepID=A0ABM5TWS7_9ACTN|nr:hypothetical protein ABB07_37800 [Streptomyces incarnatus]
MAIRDWATHAPAAATPGTTRAIAHFVGQVLADAPKDVAQAPQALHDDQVQRTRAVVDTEVTLHRLPHHRTGWMRTRCGGAHPTGGDRASGAHHRPPRRCHGSDSAPRPLTDPLRSQVTAADARLTTWPSCGVTG